MRQSWMIASELDDPWPAHRGPGKRNMRSRERKLRLDLLGCAVCAEQKVAGGSPSPLVSTSGDHPGRAIRAPGSRWTMWQLSKETLHSTPTITSPDECRRLLALGRPLVGARAGSPAVGLCRCRVFGIDPVDCDTDHLSSRQCGSKASGALKCMPGCWKQVEATDVERGPLWAKRGRQLFRLCAAGG